MATRSRTRRRILDDIQTGTHQRIRSRLEALLARHSFERELPQCRAITRAQEQLRTFRPGEISLLEGQQQCIERGIGIRVGHVWSLGRNERGDFTRAHGRPYPTGHGTVHATGRAQEIRVKKVLHLQNNRRIVRGLRPRGCFFTEPISMIRLPANTNLFAPRPCHGADACVSSRGFEGMRHLDT
nr:hypothetical protein [Pseudoxanthomonas sp.]